MCLRQAEIQTNEDGSVSSFRDRFLSGRANDLSCLPHAMSGSRHATSGQDFKGCWLLHKYEPAVTSVRRMVPTGCASSWPCFPEPPIVYELQGTYRLRRALQSPGVRRCLSPAAAEEQNMVGLASQVILGLYWDNGKSNGNYYSILGLYWDDGKENGNYYSRLE